ncbi:hypothetical protein BDB00DRAFT_852272 [Zychaea mexicana]|nr:hypothetical protein BDB00DRAFT_865225 [Zychaea mexicana]KAI9484989.1 hypothetical protein BDB00DRAFT_852272 [Zychaea mexicana]
MVFERSWLGLFFMSIFEVVVRGLQKLAIQHQTYNIYFNLRPYNREYTGSRPISAVKPCLAWSVLWWGTTWEYQVL